MKEEVLDKRFAKLVNKKHVRYSLVNKNSNYIIFGTLKLKIE